MIKIFFLLLSFSLIIQARENPFFPSTGELDIPYTTNQKENIDPLKRVTVSLPSSARTVESITVKYKNIDGSIVSTTQELGRSIDWHLPLFISQNYGDVSTPKAKKRVIKKIVGLKFITLYESKRELKIVTKDKMIRNFLLVKPHRIVCDFKRNIDIRSHEKVVTSKGIVRRVRVGNHKGYYRVVIELDGYYNYGVKKLTNAYALTLR